VRPCRNYRWCDPDSSHVVIQRRRRRARMLVDGSASSRLGCAIEHELLSSEPENLKEKSAIKESRSGQCYSFLPAAAAMVPSSLGCGSSSRHGHPLPYGRRRSSSIAAVLGRSATGALTQGAVHRCRPRSFCHRSSRAECCPGLRCRRHVVSGVGSWRGGSNRRGCSTSLLLLVPL
jgi:hypothetical protein